MKRMNKQEARRMAGILFSDIKYQDVINKLKSEWKVVTFKNGIRLRDDIYKEFCDKEVLINK